MENSSTKKLRKAIIIGATGAIGRELFYFLLQSKDYSKVTVLIRRSLDKWENLPEEQKQKFNFIKIDDLDVILKEEEINKLFNNEFDYDNLFCMLGCSVRKGEKEFTKVDYEYVVSSASLCERLKIPHFSLISSKGADASSYMLYFKVKGKAEE